jgi:alpha-2-macroglobulin
LPNVITYRALRSLGVDDPVLEANLYSTIEEALYQLSISQNTDGGWGWFSDMQSNAYVTAYALLGLAEIHKTDILDDDFNVTGMMERAEDYLKRQLIRRTNPNTAAWQLNQQAFFLYVLSRADADLDLSSYTSLHNYRVEMSYAGRAYLLMAFHEAFSDHSAVDDLASDLNSAAILSATGAHWEEDYRDWWNWGSDTRTTALGLMALTRVTPDSPLLPNVVRWLMVARQGDHWKTTQETSWAVMAFTDWMLITNELQGDYD